MTLQSQSALFRRLLLLAALVLVPPVGLLSYSALDGLRAGLEPELEQKAKTVADDLSDQFGKALTNGIPIDRLQGVEEFLEPVVKANREISFISVVDLKGHRLYTSGEPEAGWDGLLSSGIDLIKEQRTLIHVGDQFDYFVPLMVKNAPVGSLHVGVDGRYLSEKVKSILADVAVLSAVGLLVIAEILAHVVAVNIFGPLGQIRRILIRVGKGDFTGLVGFSSHDEMGAFTRRINRAIRFIDERYRRLQAYIDEVRAAHFDPVAIEGVGAILARVTFLYRFSETSAPAARHEATAQQARLALFLFVFAEELSRPFLALYAQSVPNSFPFLGPDMMMAVPIAVFMAATALASPWSGVIAGRLGCRKVFLLGVVPACLGFVMTGLAESSLMIVAGRIVTGLGYAMATMAAQIYMSATLKDEARTQGLAIFIGAVLTASVCGSGVGGILVERVGFRGVYFAAAVVALIAGALARRLPDLGRQITAPEQARPGGLWTLLRNWRFSTVMVFAAIPSKMAITGIVFFLVPLYLWKMDMGYADISRVVVIYAVVVVALSPLVARWADRTGVRLGLVAVGGLVGSVGLLAPAVDDGVAAVVVALALLGIGQGLGSSPQLALLPDICWTECRRMGQASVLAEARRLERIGSTLGPLVAAALVPIAGYGGAIVVLGAAMSAISLIFLLISTGFGKGLHVETEELGG